MGRTKLYDRDAVLEAAMQVFWQRGFADTSLQQLERATGVNKSGLYAEFKDKEDLYLSALSHYLQHRANEGVLAREPLGWGNVEELLRVGPVCSATRKGCFAVNAMRELASLPAQAAQIVDASQQEMTALLVKNIQAEDTKLPAAQVAELVMVFFSGLCIEMNMAPDPASVERKIATFMTTLKNI